MNINFIWAGDPVPSLEEINSEKTVVPGQDFLGPLSIAENLQTNRSSHKVRFFCSDVHIEHYKSKFLDKVLGSFEVIGIESYLNQQKIEGDKDTQDRADWVLNKIKIGCFEYNPIRNNACIKDMFALYLLMDAEGCYVLDTNIFPKNDAEPVTFPDPEKEFMMVNHKGEGSEGNPYDCYLQASRPNCTTENLAIWHKYVSMFCSLEKRKKIMSEYHHHASLEYHHHASLQKLCLLAPLLAENYYSDTLTNHNKEKMGFYIVNNWCDLGVRVLDDINLVKYAYNSHRYRASMYLKQIYIFLILNNLCMLEKLFSDTDLRKVDALKDIIAENFEYGIDQGKPNRDEWMKDNVPVIEYLLSRRANPMAVSTFSDAKCNNALHISARYGCKDLAEMFLSSDFITLEQKKMLLSQSNSAGKTPLAIAREMNNCELVKELKKGMSYITEGEPAQKKQRVGGPGDCSKVFCASGEFFSADHSLGQGVGAGAAKPTGIGK